MKSGLQRRPRVGRTMLGSSYVIDLIKQLGIEYHSVKSALLVENCYANSHYICFSGPIGIAIMNSFKRTHLRTLKKLLLAKDLYSICKVCLWTRVYRREGRKEPPYVDKSIHLGIHC